MRSGLKTMINWLHSRFNRPENGYDPVPPDHVIRYGANEWSAVDEDLLNDLELWVGGFAGKKVLGLGGGPGQFSVALAKRGGEVTWFDVSRNYRDMAQRKANEYSVEGKIQFVLGYMDDAPAILNECYDFVFNRICFNYCRSDQSFAETIYKLVRNGGYAYVDTTHDQYKYETLSAQAKMRVWLNSKLGIKIGHPFPPHGRLAKLFLKFPVKKLMVDYSSPLNDRVRFEKI